MKTGDKMQFWTYKQGKVGRKKGWVQDTTVTITLASDPQQSDSGFWRAKATDGACDNACSYIVTWRHDPNVDQNDNAANILFVRSCLCSAEHK